MAQSTVSTGQFDNVSGNVLIERSGEFFRTDSDSNFIAGDRIITIDGGQADIKLDGCSLSISDASSVLVTSSKSCDDIFVVTSLEIGDSARDASLTSLELEGLGISALAASLAAAAVIAGVIVVVDDNDDDDDGTSP